MTYEVTWDFDTPSYGEFRRIRVRSRQKARDAIRKALSRHPNAHIQVFKIIDKLTREGITLIPDKNGRPTIA